MAGLRGNNAFWMIQKQSALGTAATPSATTTIKTPYSAGALAPERQIGTLAETDASRDIGVAYVKTTGVKGNPELYVRDASIVPLLFGVLGTEAITTLSIKVKWEAANTFLYESALTGTTEAMFKALLAEASTAEATTIGGTAPTAGTKLAGTTTVAEFESNKKVKTSGNSVVALTGEVSFPYYTRTLVPNNSLPYYTLWSALGIGASEPLFEEHIDCMVSDLEVKATAGSPLTAQATILGRETKRLTSEPGASVPMQKGTAYNFNFGNIEIGGVPEPTRGALVSSMTLQIANNVTAQQTDKVKPVDVAVGKRQVSCTFDLIFENPKEYNKFMYGGEAGTEIATGIYTTSLKFQYAIDSNHIIEFFIPKFAYEEFPISPEVQGNPVVVAVKGIAQRETNIITATVKNTQQSY